MPKKKNPVIEPEASAVDEPEVEKGPEKIQLVLIENRSIRGTEFAPGTIILQANAMPDFGIADVNKAIQAGAVRAYNYSTTVKAEKINAEIRSKVESQKSKVE